LKKGNKSAVGTPGPGVARNGLEERHASITGAKSRKMLKAYAQGVAPHGE